MQCSVALCACCRLSVQKGHTIDDIVLPDLRLRLGRHSSSESELADSSIACFRMPRLGFMKSGLTAGKPVARVKIHSLLPLKACGPLQKDREKLTNLWQLRPGTAVHL